MIKLRYGNTNTFFLQGNSGNLLIDTDYAGTLPAFYQAIGKNGIRVKDITYVLATHYHPDHMGIIGDLQEQGVKLLLVDVQLSSVHDPDRIFARENRLHFRPVQETSTRIITCQESRPFLKGIGLSGEILYTPSHSKDSVSLILDNGDCFVGDLEPLEYLAAYEDNEALAADWDLILSRKPKHIFYAHVNDKIIQS